MRLKIAAMIYVSVFTLFAVEASTARQQAPAAAAVALPAIDAASLKTLAPIVAHLNDLNDQMREAQSQYRVAAQSALDVAKLDPVYYGVRFTPTGQVAFVQLRAIPQKTAAAH